MITIFIDKENFIRVLGQYLKITKYDLTVRLHGISAFCALYSVYVPGIKVVLIYWLYIHLYINFNIIQHDT